MKNKSILITGGPTWVPIDDMRIISNRSTGKIGHLLALACQKAGAKVTLLEGPVEERIQSKTIKVIPFHFFDELNALLKTELLKKYDIVIHAAAVSDYQLKKTFKTKINSDAAILHLDLTPTPKLINIIKKLSPQSILVGFKLESKMTVPFAIKETQKLFQEAKCDLVIANSFNKTNVYKGFILNASGEILAEMKSREDIINSLLQILRR